MSLPFSIPPEIRLHFALERRFPLNNRERWLKYTERLLIGVLIVSLVLEWGNFLSSTDLNRLWGLALVLIAGWLFIYWSVLFSRYQYTCLFLGQHPRLPKINYFTLESELGDQAQLKASFSLRLGDEVATAGDEEAIKKWLEQIKENSYFHRAWWRWENLAKIPGLAKNWNYGETYRLERYGDFINTNSVPASDIGLTEVTAVEQVLNRRREANVIIVGEAGSAEGILERLAGRMMAGMTWPGLEGKRLFVLSVGRLITNFESQVGLGEELLLLVQEAAHAGNVILVFDDLPRLTAYLSRLGTPLATLLDSYLAGSALTVIGLADPAAYHGVLEPDAVLMNRFEVVMAEGWDLARSLRLVTERLVEVENETGLLFTYGAAKVISQSLENYFTEGDKSSETEDLLEELVPSLIANGIQIVKKSDVLAFVKQKTKIPMGEVTPDERAKLLALPERLKERVIGQEAALVVIESAVRRSRAATRNTSRPMGTFLFLGPTGVGKTETAKALSTVLFGNESSLLRLDMSEYAAPGSLYRLIGSFESGTPGVLAKLAREHPYGVLLLDEFEKTEREVLDLFLQIFDEGFFTDMNGRRVNMRSLLIIATSNAGADLVWELVSQKVSLQAETNKIVDHLVKEGIFKPELLNRFDAVVVYEPLSEESLKKIARLQLEKLAKRLIEQGITLVITDNLVEEIVKHGANRQFGARPMQRLIQDTVEDEIAKAIIDGRVIKGNKVSFIPSRRLDTNLLELDLHVE